jgi:taurine transport system ATP-binding protein
VRDGEFISIVGPSGCGKSTLMRMVAGLLPVTSGTLLVGGRGIVGPVTELGIVFQQPVLLDWRNALDNVLFQVEMRGERPGPWRERALALLDQVGLKDFAASFPHQLSGGMRQRVAIARALVHEPGLLLMDEPFGALDSLTREQMQELLISIWDKTKKTIFLITHSIDEALSLATRIVVMSPRPGRIVARYEVDYVRQFSKGGDWSVIKTDPGFVCLREEIRALIHKPERAEIPRERILAHE